MTLSQLLTDLNERIGSEPEVDNAHLTTWLNQGLLTFCNTYDYHWLRTRKTASTVSGQERYQVPSNMKRMIEVKIGGDRYQYVPYEQRDMYTASQKTYSILNNYIYVNPTPSISTSNNIQMSYVIRPSKMTADSDSPSDSDIANLPEVYHEALVIYAFAIYNGYDEEHGEQEALMGSALRPRAGTFNWYVREAKKEEALRKRGTRRRMLKTKEYYGYSNPNQLSSVATVLGN
jgi:hypothetical protein